MRLPVLLMLCALSGCFGFDEKLEACRRGEGVCAVTSELDAGTGCEPLMGDLLDNGSFERLTANSTVAGWTASAPIVLHEGGAAACLRWVEVTSTTDPVSLETDFDLSPVPPLDTRFKLGVTARTLDGNAAPLLIEFRVRSGNYRTGTTARLNGDGTWTELAVELPLTQDSGGLNVMFYSLEPRSLGFDRAYVQMIAP